MEITEPITVRCSAVVFRGDGVLLCHRPATDSWVLPGGSPFRSEGASECVRREVLQETGLAVTPRGVVFVLDATSPKGEQHLFEIIFGATDDDPSTAPHGSEDQLDPSFVRLDALADLTLLPPIGEQLREFAKEPPDHLRGMAAYLGNVWQPVSQPARS
jgi:8-oxo-dGTP diphosphatase